MYQKVLAYFAQICAIPHASFHTKELFAYLTPELESLGFVVRSDEARNIYAKKGDSKPVCCLQGHYDMVCVGAASRHTPIETYEEQIEGVAYLRARDSSLGADNGIALACMLALGKEMSDFEVLITNDEEVGMLGAKNLQMLIESEVLLNLDSEDISEIVLGCAGGVDLSARSKLEPTHRIYDKTFVIRSKGFVGGHSGVDIHKNIPNAIVEFAHFLIDKPAQILSLRAGEKRNSIPVGVECVVVASEDFCQYANAMFAITPLKSGTESSAKSAPHSESSTPLESNQKSSARLESSAQLIGQSHAYAAEILSPIIALHSGVYEIESSTKSVIDSLNLSCARVQDGALELDLFARANDDAKLARMQRRVGTLLGAFGMCVESSDFYSAWKRNISDDDALLAMLIELYEANGITPHITQIHAGLECGILGQRLRELSKPTPTKILSIGPTIDFPHSTKERLNLESLRVFVAILQRALQNLGARV